MYILRGGRLWPTVRVKALRGGGVTVSKLFSPEQVATTQLKVRTGEV